MTAVRAFRIAQLRFLRSLWSTACVAIFVLSVILAHQHSTLAAPPTAMTRISTAVEVLNIASTLRDIVERDGPAIVDGIKYNYTKFAAGIEADRIVTVFSEQMVGGDGILMWFPTQRIGEEGSIGKYLHQGPIPMGIGENPALVAASFLSQPLESVSPELARMMLGKLVYENGSNIPKKFLKASLGRSYFLWFQKTNDGKFEIHKINDSAGFVQEAMLDLTRLKLLRVAQQSDDTIRNLVERSLHFRKLERIFSNQLRQNNLAFDLQKLMSARIDANAQLKKAHELMMRARADARHNSGLSGFATIFGFASLAAKFDSLSASSTAKANYQESAADRSHTLLQTIDVKILVIFKDSLSVDPNQLPSPKIKNPWKKGMK
mgnify:CR=1 FL=1